MKKKPAKKQDQDVVDGWYGTFSDMVTLLMAFFVLLYAMSDPDPGKYQTFSDAMQTALTGKELDNEFQELTDNLQTFMDDSNLSDKVNVTLNSKGIEIQMEGSSLFEVCEADIITDMKPIISKITTVITDLLDNSSYNGYMIEVKGHTDNLPPTNCRNFNTNWELSAYRATGMVEELFESGIQKNKLKVIAMADSEPLVPNTDEDGKSIPKNQAKNRRVEIFINKFD